VWQPNPQDAFPLPSRPNLEHYKKLAKALLKARGDRDAIAKWAPDHIDELSEFAKRRLSVKCTLSEAQFVIARAYGFLSWPKFAKYIASPVSNFEKAADAIISGDEATLKRMLREDPKLIRARSEREHRATLLHYVSANGVENYRQKSPKNAARIAEVLLNAGAEVDAEADVYGSGWTTLGLVATSAPPDAAGVQIPLLDLLLNHGARTLSLSACIANGQPRAARFLADRGAPFDLMSAAALGRLDLLPKLKGTRAEKARAFVWACAYGQNDVAEYFLDHGVDIAAQDKDGQTGLHWAVIGAQMDTIEFLLARNAPVEIRNVYGGTVLGQAWWSAEHGGDPKTYKRIIARLIERGARAES